MFAWLESVAGRLVVFTAVAALLVKVALPIGYGGVATITSTLTPPDAAEVFAATNRERLALKLGILERSSVLDAAAQAKLSDMAARGYFAHVTPDGRQPWDFVFDAGYRYQAAGENLAKGFDDTAAVVPAWMQSPSHRGNITNSSYRHMGIAAQRVTYNGASTVLVVQMFGAPAAVAAVPKAQAPRRIAHQPSAPQSVSTVRSIAPVTEPSVVAGSSAGVTATVSASVNSLLAAWLSVLAALLTVAIAVRGHRRPLVAAWLGALSVLAFVTLVPALKTGQGLIF